MRYLCLLSIILMTVFISGCNTLGGFGQDVTKAGKAIEKASE